MNLNKSFLNKSKLFSDIFDSFSYSFFKLSSISFLGKLIGFVKIIFLIRLFTNQNLTDSVFLLLAILWFWGNDLIYTLFSNSLIPKISKFKNDKIRFRELIKMISGINFIMILLIILILIFPNFLPNLFSPSGSYELKTNLSKFIFYCLPLFILMPITEIFTLFNQYKENYIISSLNLLISNILQFISIFLTFYFFKVDDFFLLFSISIFFSYLINSIIQIYYSGFLLYFNFSKIFKVSFNNFKYYFTKNKSFFTSIFIFQSIVYINLILLSYLDEGSITLYNSIVRISDVIQSIIISKLIVIYFNKISKNTNLIYEEIIKYFKSILFLNLILVFLFKFFGNDIIIILYGNEYLDRFSDIDQLLIFSCLNIYLYAKLSFLIKSIIVVNIKKILLKSSIVFISIIILINYLFLIKYGINIVIISQIISNFFITFYIQYKLFNKIKLKLSILDLIYLTIFFVLIYI